MNDTTNPTHHSPMPVPTQEEIESMSDAHEASRALSLPYYWFADPRMRARYRIPHYLLGGLVRFRMSELFQWAAKSNSVQTQGDDTPEEMLQNGGGARD